MEDSTSTIKSIYKNNQGPFPIDFETVLNSYYNKDYDYTNHPYTKTVNDIDVITADVDRSFSFIRIKRTQAQFREHLNKIINKLHITYYQGMSDIISFIIYYYVGVEKLEYTDELEEKILKICTKILVSKISPLVMNDFYLYKYYNDIFLEMMRKQGEKIDDDQNAFIFMKYILTFFTRLCHTIDDMYIMISIVLSTPLNCSFVLLFKFYNMIKQKKKITFFGRRSKTVEKINLEDETFLEEIIKLEHQFLKTESEMDKPNITVNKGRLAYLVGGVVAIGVGLTLAFLSKKD